MAAGNNCCAETASVVGSYWNTGSKSCTKCRAFCETGLTQTVDCQTPNRDGSTANRVCKDQTKPVITLTGNSPTTQEGGHKYVDPGFTGVDSFEGDISGRVQFNLPDMRSIRSQTVTYQLIDSAGNRAATKTRVCNVIDTTPPLITIVGEATQEVHLTHEGGTQYTDPGAVAFDLVDGKVAVATTGSDFDNTHVKVHTVTYTSVDANQNKKSVSRTVTVVDTNIPVITLIGSALINVHAHRSKTYVDDGATAEDLVDGDVTDAIIKTDTVDLSKPTTYVVAFDVTDAAGLKAKTVHRKVIVEDVIPPTISLKGNLKIDVEAGSDYVEPGWLSEDELDGDVSNTVEVTFKDSTGSAVPGIDTMVPDRSVFTVTYAVTDAAGNTFALDRIVTVRDRTAPVLTLTQTRLNLEFDIEYNEPGWSATDTLNGDLSGRVAVDGPYVLTGVGQSEEVPTTFNAMAVADVGTAFAIKYSCIDDAGNAATAIRVVTVVDTVIPVLTLVGARSIEHEGGTKYTDGGATATDNYDNAQPRRCAGCASNGLTGDITNEINMVVLVGGQQVKMFDEYAPAGTLYTLQYVVKDSSQNVAVPLERQVLIIDTRAPTITILDEAGIALASSNDSNYVLPHLDFQAGSADSKFVDPGFVAEDVLDGAVTDRVAISYVQTNLATKKLSAECGGGRLLADSRAEGRSNTDVPFINTAAEAAGTSYLITYTVSDVVGNNASAQRSVTLVDKIPPSIRRLGEANATHEAGFAYRDLGAVATDVVSGLLTGCVEMVVTSQDGSTAIDPKMAAGTRFEVAYSVQDDAGLSSNASKVLELVDTIAPQLNVLGPLESIHRVGESFAGADCVCSDAGDPTLDCGSTVKATSLNLPGVYPNTFSCTDASNHKTSKVGSVRVLPAATNAREGPTRFSVTVDLDSFRAQATTTTTTTTAATTGTTVGLDFEISFPAPENTDGSGSGDGGSTAALGPEAAARELELLLRTAIENTGNIPFGDDDAIPGVACKQVSVARPTVCTVVIKGTGVDGGAALSEAVGSIGGTITGESLAVVGFESAIVLNDDTSLERTFDFPKLDMSTADINAITVGLERALGGDVINAGVSGVIRWRAGADGKEVTALVKFQSLEAAEKSDANELGVRLFAMGVYRQLTETNGNDSSGTVGTGTGTPPGKGGGDSGNSLDRAAAIVLLNEANFANVGQMQIHCTDGVCVFWGRDMPAQSQFDKLSALKGVLQASKMTVKIAAGAERIWYAAYLEQTDNNNNNNNNKTLANTLSKIEAAGLMGVSIRRRKCEGDGRCPILFSSMPSKATLTAVEVIAESGSLKVEPYVREVACFEPDLQGGPSDDEGRALLHIAGLSALEVKCSPGTVCCFATAFPYDLEPLQKLTQVSRVSATVFGPPAAGPRTVILFMAPSARSDITKSIGAIQAAVEGMLAVTPGSDRQRLRRVGTNAVVRVDCDDISKQHCTASFEGGGVSTDAMSSLRSAVGKLGVVAYSPVTSTELTGSVAFSPANVAVDEGLARYLMVENGIDAKDVACAAGGCKYTVSSLRDLPAQVTESRAVDLMDHEVGASVTPVVTFKAKGAFQVTAKFDPITTSEGGHMLTAAGILASSVECSRATCVFEVDYFSAAHTQILKAAGDIKTVISPLPTAGAGPNTFAGSFSSATGKTLSSIEAVAVLLSAGIVADDTSVVCTRGVCNFETSVDVGLAGITMLFDALAESTTLTEVSGPVLVDELFMLEKAILDSIIDSAGARPNQIIFNGILNQSSGEVSFSIIPACGASGNIDGKPDERRVAEERALAEADGCVEASDLFVNGIEFDGSLTDLTNILEENAVSTEELRDEGGGSFVVVTNVR